MKSYFKFLSRNALYTLIEAAGLAVSLGFVILIGSYGLSQLAITREHPDRERIYLLGMPDYYGLTWGFRQSAEGRIPEIEQIVSFTPDMDVVYSIGDEQVVTTGCAVDPGFFELFPYYRLLEGSADALRSKSGMLVSRRFARAHDLHVGSVLGFGDEQYTVGGVVEDFDNTIFRYVDVFVSQDSERNKDAWEFPYDRYGSVIPIIKLRADADFDAFAEKIEALCREIYPLYGDLFLEYVRPTRFDKVFFDEEVRAGQFNHGDWQTLRILLVVVALLLVSAIFNYINLNTALSGRRAKEMATRRLLGASRGAIIGKYIGESIGFTACCFGFGLLLAYAFAPTLDRLLNNPDVTVQVRLTPAILCGFGLLIVLVGVVSGLVPALLAARFQPIDVMKGSFRRRNKMVFSKVFIVLQYALAIFLLAMALVMEMQYAKSLDRPVHAAIADKFYLGPVQGRERMSFFDRASALPCVRRIGYAAGVPGCHAGGQYSETRTGDEILYRTFRMDSTAFAMLEFEKVRDFGAPLCNSVWFGERAFAATGFDDDYYDISQTLAKRMSYTDQVAGTFVEFPINTSNMGEEEYEIIQVLQPEGVDKLWGNVLIETTGDPDEAKRQLIECYRRWTEDNVGLAIEPRNADYLAGFYAEGLRPAHNNMRLLELFMLLAILISVLGLVAMSTYYAGEQAKSISIRKVFGGTVESETWKSVRGYMLQVAVACAIGLPVAVWAAGRYLEEYIYRIEHYGWIFAVAVLLAVAVAFLSVIWQTLRAARTNPATELKKE